MKINFTHFLHTKKENIVPMYINVQFFSFRFEFHTFLCIFFNIHSIRLHLYCHNEKAMEKKLNNTRNGEHILEN